MSIHVKQVETITKKIEDLQAVLLKVPDDAKIQENIKRLQEQKDMFQKIVDSEKEKAAREAKSLDAKKALVTLLGKDYIGRITGEDMCPDVPCTAEKKCVKCRVGEYQKAGLTVDEIKLVL